MSRIENRPKIIAVVGPTASGKSDLAVDVALFINKNRKKFGVKGTEIISADSRQVYKWMDIGSNKVSILYKPAKRLPTKLSIPSPFIKGGIQGYYRSIPHHLLSVASPKNTFTVVRYQKLATKAIKQILDRKNIPIICGGTGQYIDAVLFGYQFPNVKPNPVLRTSLDKMTVEKLLLMLQKKDPAKANTIDRYNKRRLIRALEIIFTTGKPIPPLETKLKFDVLIIGISANKNILKKRIEKRLDARLKKGLIKEVYNLHNKHGLSWNRLESFGLEYRFAANFLEGKISKNEMLDKIVSESVKYTKRQMTWFKKNKNIVWVDSKQKALSLVESFL